jgi:hypothetical protein
VVLPILLWLQIATTSHEGFTLWYALSPAVGLLGAGYLLFRVLRSAHQVRTIYRDAATKEKKKFPDVDVPSDPTEPFLGAGSWQLPAVVSAVLASAWAALELLGVRDRILKALL